MGRIRWDLSNIRPFGPAATGDAGFLKGRGVGIPPFLTPKP